MNYPLLLVPLFTVLACWLIVRLIHWSVFRPVKAINFFGLKWKGLLPRCQSEAADAIGSWAAKEIAGENSTDRPAPGFDRIRPTVEAHMDDFLRNRLGEKMPMVSMFIGDRTIQDLKVIFIQEIEELFPRVMAEFAGQPGNEGDIAKMISGKIKSIPPGQLESLVKPVLSSKIKTLYLLAIITGLLIGIIQVLILWYAHP